MRVAADLSGRRVYIDANIFIYFLDRSTAHFAAAAAVLEAGRSGAFAAVTGQAVIAEVLVGPYRQRDPLVVRKVKEFFSSATWLEVVGHSAQAFDDAALLRGTSDVPFIDALHVATAASAGCACVLTQDAGMKPALGVEIVGLD